MFYFPCLKLRGQTFSKLCCVSRICASQEWFIAVCVRVHACVRVCKPICSQANVSFLTHRAALLSEDRLTLQHLYSLSYSLFQITRQAEQLARTVAATAKMKKQQKNPATSPPKKTSHPTLLIPCFHTSKNFSPACKSQMTETKA